MYMCMYVYIYIYIYIYIYTHTYIHVHTYREKEGWMRCTYTEACARGAQRWSTCFFLQSATHMHALTHTVYVSQPTHGASMRWQVWCLYTQSLPKFFFSLFSLFMPTHAMPCMPPAVPKCMHIFSPSHIYLLHGSHALSHCAPYTCTRARPHRQCFCFFSPTDSRYVSSAPTVVQNTHQGNATKNSPLGMTS